MFFGRWRWGERFSGGDIAAGVALSVGFGFGRGPGLPMPASGRPGRAGRSVIRVSAGRRPESQRCLVATSWRMVAVIGVGARALGEAGWLGHHWPRCRRSAGLLHLAAGAVEALIEVPAVGQVVTTKRGLAPLGPCSIRAITRRSRSQSRARRVAVRPLAAKRVGHGWAPTPFANQSNDASPGTSGYRRRRYHPAA